MPALRIVFSPQRGELGINNETYPFPPYCFVVTDVDTKINPTHLQAHCFDFHAGDLQGLYYNIIDLLDQGPQALFHRQAVRLVPVDDEIIQVVQLLANANPSAFLRFVYVYCLGHDRRYFSALLRQSVASDQPFLDFIEGNFLNPWPVSFFAQEFGLPARKFNMLFQEKFGTSAKHWLLVRRLNHARELLLSTSMRVIDIAIECGFNNHAHFTGSFRKYFHQSPSEVRLHGDECHEQPTKTITKLNLEKHYGY